MRLHDQDRVGKWVGGGGGGGGGGKGDGSFSVSLNIYIFSSFVLFQFSPIFSLRENGWKSVYGNSILCLKAVKFA